METVDIGWLERAGAAFVTVDEVIANFATGQGFHSFSEIAEEDLRSLQARRAGQSEVLAALSALLGLGA